MILPEAYKQLQQKLSGIPEPDAGALSHSLKLTQRLQSAIDNNNGRISFRQYMERVLYEPGLGYYSAGARKIGKDGDFITAPEVSSLFSRCLGSQCQEILSGLEVPVILELGAGSGVMARDLLMELRTRNSLPDKYLILETSADLKQRQKACLSETMPDYYKNILWLDGLPEDPINAVVLANEVIDALPVHRIMFKGEEYYELHVIWTEEGFAFQTLKADQELATLANKRFHNLSAAWPDGYITEINMDIDPWLNSLSNSLNKGVIIFIDYGYSRHEYYHPQRTDGTLLCHYRHRAHGDPFIYPGLQDITASVDFTAVAEAAMEAALSVRGYTTQAHFLMATGLGEMLNEVIDNNDEFFKASQQAKLLTLPGEMGERFKVIALGKHYDDSLSGFSLVDHRARL